MGTREKSLPGREAQWAHTLEGGEMALETFWKRPMETEKDEGTVASDKGALGRVKSPTSLGTTDWARSQHLTKRDSFRLTSSPVTFRYSRSHQVPAAWTNQSFSLGELECETEKERKTQKERKADWQINGIQSSGWKHSERLGQVDHLNILAFIWRLTMEVEIKRW